MEIVRSFINLPVQGPRGPITAIWLLDTGSEVSIWTLLPPNKLNKTKNIVVQGIGGEVTALVGQLSLLDYDKIIPIEVVFMPAPSNILGVKEIKRIFPDFLQFKKIKKYICNLAEVKIEPVKLPSIPPSFTPQYPIKGGIPEITQMVKDLLKEGIITPTQNFNYNSPVWPVQKPNGKWRFTVDYRKINELSPKMPGQLPDVEDINLRIRQNSPRWLASIDLTDMFFGIPLHPDSQEFTTFTWQNKQYKFLRLPQGYLNSPIIAHSALTTTLKDFEPIGDTLYDSYIDNVIIYGSVKEDVDKTL